MFCTTALENVFDHRGLRQTPFEAVSYYLSKIWEILKPHPKVVCFFLDFFFLLMWTVLIMFVTILFLFYVLFFGPPGRWDLSSLARGGTCPPTPTTSIGGGSLYHLAPGKVPVLGFLNKRLRT